MPKIQFKRKKSTGIGTNKLSAGEPLYNLYDKKLYIGGNASSDETPSKHLTEVGVSTAGKVSIGAATDNDFTIKAGTGISVSGNTSNRNITIASNPTLTNNDTEANNVVSFTIDGKSYYKAIAVNIPGTSDEAKKLTTPRKIALAGAVTGETTFDGSADVTLNVEVADNSHNHTISATGTDGLMDVTATGGANSVTVAVAPYTSQQSKASFDTSTTAPKLTTRLNYNGDLYATNMYGNNSSGTPTKVVLTDDSRLSDKRDPKNHSHGNITNGGIVGDANRVVITDKDSKITTSSITTTKLGYLTDVTSNIQAQINGKAPTSHKHKVSSTVTSGTPSATVECVNITVADGVLSVASVTAAGDAHTHSVTITDAETGGPI